MKNFENLEIEEYDIELLSRGDYEGVLQLRQNQLSKYPDDYYTKYKWAEILTIMGKYKDASLVLSELHTEEPEDEDVIDLMLDCFRETDQNPNNFDWVVKPQIIFLTEGLIDEIKQHIKGKRGANKSINTIYIELSIKKEHLFFTEEGFFDYLKKSIRVETQGDNLFDSRIVKID